MKMRSKEIKMVAIEKLKPHPKNMNKHPDEQIERLCEIIEYQGFRNPLVVQKGTGLIVAGHGRLMAAKKLKMTQVPVIYQEFESEEQLYAYIVSDNAIASWAELDLKMIETELLDLDMPSLELLGIKDFELTPLENDKDADDIPEPTGYRVKKGEVWKLGEHRLMCGDATVIADMKKLTDKVMVDMFLTDPPYNVDYVGKSKKAMKIQNDKMDDDSFRQFLRDSFYVADQVMKKGASFYVWHADVQGYNFRGACLDVGWVIRQCLIWNKNVMVMGRQDYHWKHEPCLYGWKEGAGHLWASDRKQTTILNFARPSKNPLHPTSKPVALIQ